MVLKEILGTISSKFFSDKNTNIMYFSVPEAFLNIIPSYLSDNLKVIDLAYDFTPIKPFLGIISNYKPSDSDITEISYTLQRNTFQTFFKTGLAERRLDLIIKEEVFFEQQMINAAVKKLLYKYLSDNYIILNAQLLPEESLNILKNLDQSKLKGKLIFCFNYSNNEDNSVSINEFYQSLSSRKNFFEITDMEESVFTDENFQIQELPSYNTIYSCLRNCRHFLSIDQGVSFIKWIETKQDSFNFSKKQMRSIQLESGVLYYYANLYDSATFFLNNIIEHPNDDQYEISALYCLCQINFERNVNTNALKYAHLVKQKLADNQENPFFALANMMDYIITQKASSDTIQSVERYEKTLALLENQCLINNYLSTLLVVPWATLNDYDTPYNMMPKIEKAIETAEMLGNKSALSTAYNWKGILLLHNGRTNDANTWYEKCNQLRTEIGDLFAMMKIRNGISFEYLISSQFEESYNLLNTFIGRITEVSDKAEIIITLGNVANSLFYSRHFPEAYLFFQKMLQFMFMFNLDINTSNSFLPEYNDILTYKSFIDLANGYVNRVKIDYHTITHNGKPVTTINSPVRYLIKAILELEEKNIAGAEKTISECDKVFAKFSNAQNYRHVFIYYEFAFALKQRFHDELSEKYFRKGFEIAKNNNLSYFTQNNDNLTIEEYFNSIKPFGPSNLKLSDLDTKAEKEKLMTQMHKRLRDSQFLNKIMTYGSDSTTSTAYARQIAQALQDYILPDAIFIATKNKSKWTTIASLAKVDKLPLTQENWKLLAKNVEVTDSSNPLTYVPELEVFYANLSKYDFEGAIAIIPEKDNAFTSEELNVLNIAISNIQAQLVMRNQNDHLIYISSTDQLSLLKNRRALQEKLTMESEVVKRCQRKQNKKMQVSISFMDLDNFKIVNDTFGHDAGDLIITKFAHLLKSVYRKADFVSRFGGDEFVVLLPNTDCDEALMAAERLREQLEKADHFIPDLEKLLNKEVFIKPEQKLGFSMGICSNYDVEELTDLESTMTNADRALYFSKEHGKNRVTVWNEIKHIYKEE